MIKKNTGTTKFDKALFHFDGMYLVYGKGQYTKDARFLARFKYTKRDKASFIKFLIANFTVEEYFQKIEETVQSPYQILKAKGWVSPTEKKAQEAWHKAAQGPVLSVRFV